MARFDVYERRESKKPPYLLSLQSDFHRELRTCVMAPLTPEKASRPEHMLRLTPIVTLKGIDYRIHIPEIAALPISRIGKKIGSVADEDYVITAALDFLFQGF